MSDHALTVGGIERRTARVVGYFEATSVAAGDAIKESLAVISPHGQMRIAEAKISGGWAEEKNILLGRQDHLAQRFRKQFAQPRPACKYILVGLYPRAIRQPEVSKRRIFETFCPYLGLPVFAARRDEVFDHRLATGAGVEVAALRFENTPAHIAKVDLRPAALHLSGGELAKLYSFLPKPGQRSALEGVVAAAGHP